VTRVAARGLTFDVRVAGPTDAAATVLLLHGFPQHGGLWDAVAARLHRAGLRTVAPDQRGYSPGARPAEASAYGVPQCAEDAVAILAELALPAGPLHVVGHDWGAAVGWHLAANRPDLVATLTAVSVPHPVALNRGAALDPEQRARLAYVLLFRQAGKAEQVLLRDDAAALRAVFAGSGLDDAGIEAYVGPLREPGALTGALNWYRARDTDLLDRLGPVAVPTTYVWSDEDLAIAQRTAESCEQYVTGDYRFVALPGVSHWIPDQAPGPLSDAILARIG
jgi:pimeloyl-ACP methyl ester carboxylesterase